MAIYYTYVDKIDDRRKKRRLSQPIDLELHCLEQGFADSILTRPAGVVHQAILEAQNLIITLRATLGELERIFRVADVFDTESNWYLLYTGEQGDGLVGTKFIDSNPGDEGTPMFVRLITEIPEELPARRLLDEKISLDTYPDANMEELEWLLRGQTLRYEAEFIAAYNVGHGNCNAICSSSSQPLLYFDFGGGFGPNKHTYPTNLNFCFSADPPIILSHWDTDHFQSAKHNSNYLTRNWILPRQKISNVYIAFYLSITGGKLIWPSLVPPLTFGWGTIGYCNGSINKKNDSGLAFSAVLQPSINRIDTVLLPADAAYKYIPFMLPDYKGLVATHHGAEFVTGNNPVAPVALLGQRAIVYSYGTGNSYKHPRRPAHRAHRNAGWTQIRRTPKGHVALNSARPVSGLLCGGSQCNLLIAQTF